MSEAQLRTARHAYFAMTSYFDAQVGRLLGVLDRIRATDNTFVFVISDHAAAGSSSSPSSGRCACR